MQSIAEIEAELARATAEQETETARQTNVVSEARTAYGRSVIHAHKDLDGQLQEEGQNHLDRARRSLHDLDIGTAYEAFTRWKATRVARSQIRTAAANAAINEPEESVLHDLRDVAQTFSEWLHMETSGALRPEWNLGAAIAEELIGEAPATYEEAAAYLERKNGN